LKRNYEINITPSKKEASGLSFPAVKERVVESLGRDVFTCSYNDILASDLVLVFGHDVTEDYPVIALKVRKAIAGGS
jgi:predicted molibdopterin-dependent oxidoreductase YjgC